jgi:hypothetical protein
MSQTKGSKLKWYDYFFCMLYADMISAGIVNFDIWVFTIGVFLYIVYELTRKELNNATYSD